MKLNRKIDECAGSKKRIRKYTDALMLLGDCSRGSLLVASKLLYISAHKMKNEEKNGIDHIAINI